LPVSRRVSAARYERGPTSGGQGRRTARACPAARLQRLLEEVGGPGVVVVAVDLPVAGTLVHGDRLGQRLVGVQPEDRVAEGAGLVFQVTQQAGAEAGAAPVVVDP